MTENEVIAKAYNEAADVFEVYASDQLASARLQSTRKARDACMIKCKIWTDAARELREAAKKK